MSFRCWFLSLSLALVSGLAVLAQPQPPSDSEKPGRERPFTRSPLFPRGPGPATEAQPDLQGPRPERGFVTKPSFDTAWDPKAPGVGLEVIFVLVKGSPEATLFGTGTVPANDMDKKFKELQQQNQIGSLRRFSLTTLEGQPAMAMVGDSVPFVTGINVMGGRGFRGGDQQPPTGKVAKSITYRNVGTSVTALPRVVDKKEVALDLRFQHAWSQATEPGVDVGQDEKGNPIPATTWKHAQFEGKIRVPVGQFRLVDGVQTGGKASEQIYVLVSARVLE